MTGTVLLVVAALSGIASPPLHAQDAQSIVGRSSTVYRSLASLSADFVQIIDNPMIDSAESRGTLIQAGPSKLSMRFTDPPGEAVVIDGRYVWVYTPSTVPDQVLRVPHPRLHQGAGDRRLVRVQIDQGTQKHTPDAFPKSILAPRPF